MSIVTAARAAMATRFEIVLHGCNEMALRACAEAALDEIDRIEAQLSFYRPTSQISDLNARAASGPVRVDPALFQFLEQARRFHALSQGAFDPTIGPLMRCWGFTRGSGHVPSPADLEAARQVTGMDLVTLAPGEFTVHYQRKGVSLDPGAIGKGYAIECAAEILLDAGVQSALIHGGTSTVRAIGAPPGAETWQIALPTPRVGNDPAPLQPRRLPPPPGGEAPLAMVSLRDNAVSVSAVWGKAFEREGKSFGHVLDPRRGEPVTGALMSAVITGSATAADALSTALLVLGAAGQPRLHDACPDLQSLVVSHGASGAEALEISARGEGWGQLDLRSRDRGRLPQGKGEGRTRFP
jgi:FAD:protein FMN transferase